jgi:hypothetical protein
MKRLLAAAFVALLACSAPACASDCWNSTSATQTDCGSVNMYLNGSSQAVPVAPTAPLPVTTNGVDPCQSSNVVKSSVAISITTATTTSLVSVSGSTTVYVCGFAVTIAPSATSADTLQFEYGTGAACSSPTALTGTFGNGDLTTGAPPLPVSFGGAGQTIFKSAASAGICAVTGGTTVNVQGILSYVQA